MIILRKGSQVDYLIPGDVSNCRQKSEINGDSTLTFDINLASKKAEYFKDYGMTAECNGREYIKYGENGPEFSRNASETLVSVTLHESWKRLNKKFITVANLKTPSSEFDHIDQHMVVLLGNSSDPLIINGSTVTAPFTVGTAQYLFWCILYGSGWSLDTSFAAYWPDGKFDLETDKKSVLENIEILQSLFGGMLLWDSKKKTVALVDEKKYIVSNGFTARYKHNLIGISKKENHDIVTRLYIYGSDNLNIAALNQGKEYLDNFTVTNDVLEGIVQNSNIFTQEYLLEWGKQQLSLVSRPRYTYSIDILIYPDKKELARPYIGHIARVIDEAVVGGQTDQRILMVDQNVFEQWDCKVTIGEPSNTFSGAIKDFKEAKEQVKNSINNLNKIPGGSISGSIRELDLSNIKWQQITSGISSDLSSYKTQTNNSLSTINTTISNVQGDVASVTLTANSHTIQISNMKGDISTVTQTANSISSTVTNMKGDISRIEQTANRVSIVVTSSGGIKAAEIVAAINSAGSSVKIQADKVDIAGYVTFTDLKSNTNTIINGDYIKTGYISGDRIKFTSGSVLDLASGRIQCGTLEASTVLVRSYGLLDVRADNIKMFGKFVKPFVKDGINYLRLT